MPSSEEQNKSPDIGSLFDSYPGDFLGFPDRPTGGLEDPREQGEITGEEPENLDEGQISQREGETTQLDTEGIDQERRQYEGNRPPSAEHQREFSSTEREAVEIRDQISIKELEIEKLNNQNLEIAD